MFSEKKESMEENRNVSLNHLGKTCCSLIVNFHALVVKKKYLYFEKVKKLFSKIVTFLNDLFLSL